LGEKPREAVTNNLKRKAAETIENIAHSMNQLGGYIRKREKSNSNKIIKTKIYCGIFPIDLFPQKRISRPCALIFKTDPSVNAGIHWFSIFFPKYSPIEYFDSFGIQPINSEVYEFLKINANNLVFNNLQTQSNSSETCGKFCISFILYRARGMELKKFLELFAQNKTYNEIFIYNLFKKKFQLKIKCQIFFISNSLKIKFNFQ
jgi:hypothetical protein